MINLTTSRLTIRPFELGDLDAIHAVLDGEDSGGLAQRREWLEWTVRNYSALEKLQQPPYGDLAVVVRAENKLIGSVGLVPLLAPFGLLQAFRPMNAAPDPRFTTEMGIFYHIKPERRFNQFASEAAGALVNFAFLQLNLKRLVATTHHDNLASMTVMRKLGMHIEFNPYDEPRWFQVIGIREAEITPV